MFDYNNEQSPFLISLLEVDMNSSMPSKHVSNNDILLEGTRDCSWYTWTDGSEMNIEITLDQIQDNRAHFTVEMW